MSAAEMGGYDGVDEPEEPWLSDSCGLLRHKVKYSKSLTAALCFLRFVANRSSSVVCVHLSWLLLWLGAIR